MLASTSSMGIFWTTDTSCELMSREGRAAKKRGEETGMEDGRQEEDLLCLEGSEETISILCAEEDEDGEEGIEERARKVPVGLRDVILHLLLESSDKAAI